LTSRTRAWQAAFIVAFLGASYFLLSPGDAVPSIGAGIPQSDKVEHAATFAILAFLARFAYRDRPAWGVFAALVLYGIAVEIAQRNIPGRSTEVLDALSDAAGALVAFAVRPRPAAT